MPKCLTPVSVMAAGALQGPGRQERDTAWKGGKSSVWITNNLRWQLNDSSNLARSCWGRQRQEYARVVSENLHKAALHTTEAGVSGGGNGTRSSIVWEILRWRSLVDHSPWGQSQTLCD